MRKAFTVLAVTGVCLFSAESVAQKEGPRKKDAAAKKKTGKETPPDADLLPAALAPPPAKAPPKPAPSPAPSVAAPKPEMAAAASVVNPGAALAAAETSSVAAEARGGDGPKNLRIKVSPVFGLGLTGESSLGASTPYFTFGLNGEYAINPKLSAGLSVRDNVYRRSYLTSRPDLTQPGAARLELDEQKVGIDVYGAYEVVKVLGQRVAVAGVGGPFFRIFHNSSLRSQAGGMALGGRATLSLSEALDFAGRAVYGYNLFFKNAELLSAMGGPRAVASLAGSLGLNLAPSTRFGIGYEGEVLVLRASYRGFHALAFTFDVSL